MKKYLAILCCLATLFSCSSGSREPGKNGDTATRQEASDTISQPADTSNTAEKKQEPNWPVAGIDHPETFKTFLADLQKWTANNQQDSIVAHISFPLRNYKTKETFTKKFSSIFSEKIRSAISKQSPDDIFVNAQGVMLGNGEIWINYLRGAYYITAINE